MCGIVGYVGKNISIKTAITALKKLEYRGYDSSGVAYINDKQIQHIKQVGTIDKLLSQITNQASNVCICHTRWATHGKVDINNAHPQLSPNKQFAVVHNGIIENYQQLKEQFGLKDFTSQTDTEIVAQLLQSFTGPTLQRLNKIVSLLNGSYALAITDSSEYLYVAKYKSPLYVAKESSGYMVASDICCFNSTEYYSLPDGCVARISKNKTEFYMHGKPVNLSSTINTYNFQEVALNGHKHFMDKEIDETNNVINNICTRYLTLEKQLFSKNIFKDVSNVYLVGCGTAYHACQMAEIWIKENYKIRAQAYIASELRYSEDLMDSNSLVILLSQSGETADTLACATLAKQKNAKICAITNVEYSTLANIADILYPLCAGPEIGVASTKAYSAMLSVLYLISNINIGLQQAISNLKQVSGLLNIDVSQNIIQMVSKSKRVFFIGRSCDGVSAYEGALKLKEVAYIDACGYYAGELKHGSIALIEPNVVVFAIITNNSLKSKTLNAVQEVLSRGATVVVITDDAELSGDFYKINIPLINNNQLKNILAVVPLQKLAYKVACFLGHNPDKPRNLAKSVTVE